jgi:hypothetical protein
MEMGGLMIIKRKRVILILIICGLSLCVFGFRKQLSNSVENTDINPTPSPNIVESNIPFEVLTNEKLKPFNEAKTMQTSLLDEAMEKLKKERGIERFYLGGKTYLLIASGTKPSGGYSITLKKLINQPQNLTIIVGELHPKNQATAVISYPTLLIELSDTVDKELQLIWENTLLPDYHK